MGHPDFVCMGFQKSGTTTLYDILKQHPQVALCRDVKEPMYYRFPFLDVLGMHHYYYRERYFGHLDRKDKRLRGEINAGLTYDDCAHKVRRDYSHKVKMIFMMRNPADRSYSAYKYFLARGFLPSWAIRYDMTYGHARGFDHYVHWVLDNRTRRSQIMEHRLKYMVFSQSNYGACIAEFLNGFDLKNMKFVFFEEFIQDQHAACREIYDFIGIDDVPGIDYDIKSNEGNDRVVSVPRATEYWWIKGINYMLYDLFLMSHWGPHLYDRYHAMYLRERDKCLVPDHDKDAMLPSTRRYLMRYYEPDIRKVERITGKDLHQLWKV